MKGLILKDIYCLRTQLMTYIIVLVGSLMLGILISLSSEYGNLKMDVFMGEETTVSEDDIAAYKVILGGATLLALILPLGIGYDGIRSFHMDEKANFKDVLRTLPVTPWEIVLAKFCSVYGFLLLSYLSSVLIALLISPVVSIFTLGEMVYISTVLACIAAMMVGATFCALHLWKQKTFEMIFTGVILVAYIGFGALMVWLTEYYGDEFDIIMKTLCEKGKFLFEHCLFWLLPITLLVLVGCYFLSVFIVKRKGAGV